MKTHYWLHVFVVNFDGTDHYLDGIANVLAKQDKENLPVLLASRTGLKITREAKAGSRGRYAYDFRDKNYKLTELKSIETDEKYTLIVTDDEIMVAICSIENMYGWIDASMAEINKANN